MTDRPIIFSAPMIRALLAGRLSQTRRVLKPLPRRTIFFDPKTAVLDQFQEPPYAPGDRLWVKEGWGMGLSNHGDCPRYRATMDYMCGEKIKPPHEGLFVWKSPIFMPRRFSRLTLTITDVRVQRLQEISVEDAVAEGIDVESDDRHKADFERAEHAKAVGGSVGCRPEVFPFKRLWNSIHGPDAWDANPWVAAISFTVHRCNIDKMEEGTW